MRHVYSVVRFTPDSARGEFINIGLLAGSEDSSEWVLQSVSRVDRARKLDDHGVLPEVTRRLTTIASTLDRFTEARETLAQTPSDLRINEEWLQQLASDNQNVLQFTWPRTVISASAQEAIDMLWPQLIAEPESTRRKIITKHRALADVKGALRRNHIDSDHWKEAVRLQTENSHSQLDFAVHNGRVVYLTQCWSFQVADQERLLEDVKAWAWTIRDLRRFGGEVISDELNLEVERNTPVAAVYIPPQQQGVDGNALAEAAKVFSDSDVNARGLDYGEVDALGARAAELLST